jgi:2-methylcitrate dehydratase PrpD
MELVPDAELDALYPREFPGWVAAESRGEWVRAYVANPTGSKYAPIDARGITEKFRGINPALPVDEIADVALHIERHSVRELLALLARRS